MSLYNYHCDEIKRIIEEVSPNYPQLTTYLSEWLYFYENDYNAGTPVDLEYQELSVNPYGMIENAIPYKYKSATLKGNTLINLLDETSRDTQVDTGYLFFKIVGNQLPILKPNTQYTLIFDKYVEGIKTAVFKTQTKTLSVEGYQAGQKITFTTVADVGSQFHIFIKGTTLEMAQQMLDLQPKIIILEGDHTSEDVPYFEGMQSVQNPVLTITGKNLFDGYLEKGWSSTDGSLIDMDRTRTNLIFVEKNETYTVSRNKKSTLKIDEFDENSNYIKTTTYQTANATLTTSAQTKYIRVLIAEPLDEVANHELQLEKGTQSFYEPYQANSLSIPEDVKLRGIGEVKDELNLLTGELTQCIDKVVFDGSEEWLFGTTKTNTQVFQLTHDLQNIKPNSELMCDKLKVITGVDEEIIVLANNNIYIALLKSNASSVSQLKEYLSQNPITVCYQLETPVVSTVDMNKLTNKPYEGVNHYHLTANIPCEAILEVPIVSEGEQTLQEIND